MMEGLEEVVSFSVISSVNSVAVDCFRICKISDGSGELIDSRLRDVEFISEVSSKAS